MKVVSETPGMRDFTINSGRAIKKGRDGKFHVPDSLGKSLIKSGEFMVSGTTFQTAQGYRCDECGRVNVFKDHCGRCGCTTSTPESP
jgi:hypothetical protein